MARVTQYFAILLFFLQLFLLSSILFRTTEARPFTMVQSPKKHFHVVVKDSGPSPGIGHHDYEHFDKPIVQDFGPSPAEGHN